MKTIAIALTTPALAATTIFARATPASRADPETPAASAKPKPVRKHARKNKKSAAHVAPPVKK